MKTYFGKGRQKEKRTVCAWETGRTLSWAHILEVAYPWGKKSRTIVNAPPSRVRLGHDHREAPLVASCWMSKHWVRSNTSLLWEGTSVEIDSGAGSQVKSKAEDGGTLKKNPPAIQLLNITLQGFEDGGAPKVT